MTENIHLASLTTQGRVKVKMLEFELTKGGSTEYALEDGTIVRLTPRLGQALV